MSREDAFSSAIVTINEKGIIQSVDKNCCNLFGYTPEQLLNQDVVALIPPPYKEQHSSYLRNYHETGVAKIIGKSRVVEGLHSSGTIFPILLSISSVNVGATKLYVAMIDKLEDKAGIITSNLEGTIVSCNQHCEAMFGYKVNELIGQNLRMLMPPPYSDLHDTYIKNYHATGRESVIGKVRNLVAKHKNGVVFPMCLQVYRINIGLVELFRGRIERLDTDIEAVFTLNDEGYIVSCNKTFVLPFFGYSDEELIGQHINKLFVSFYSKISAPDKALPTKRRKVEGGDVDEDGDVDESQISQDTIEWRIRDVRTAQVVHKDGSSFSVLVSVDKFTNGEAAQQYSIKIRRLPEGGSSSDDIARMGGSSSSSSTSDSSSDVVGNWILGEKIGQGSYGRVKLATHKRTGLQAAVKILQLDMMDDQEIDRSRREIKIMKQLEHPNICKILDVVESGDKLFIIMEYGAGGELQSFQKHSINEQVARRLFLQILDAISYCHNKNIIHRDIKHRNILLDADKNVKLIDFGLSNFTSGHLRSTFCGTPAYAAPEMILGKKYIGPEVDVWSMGVVLYSMLTNKFPFKDVSTIIAGKYRHPRNVSPACADLLKKMLTIDPTHRATVTEVKVHPWVLGKGTEAFLPNTFENDAPDSDDEESDSHSFDSVSFDPISAGGCPVAHIQRVDYHGTSFLKGEDNNYESQQKSGGRGGCLFGFDQKTNEAPQSPVTIDCSSRPSTPSGGCPVITHASVTTTTTTSISQSSLSTTSSNGAHSNSSLASLPSPSSNSSSVLPSSSFAFHPPLPSSSSSSSSSSFSSSSFSSSSSSSAPSPLASSTSVSTTTAIAITVPAATTTSVPSTNGIELDSELLRPPPRCPFHAASLSGNSTTTT